MNSHIVKSHETIFFAFVAFYYVIDRWFKNDKRWNFIKHYVTREVIAFYVSFMLPHLF